jgi:hypothetical protein
MSTTKLVSIAHLAYYHRAFPWEETVQGAALIEDCQNERERERERGSCITYGTRNTCTKREKMGAN